MSELKHLSALEGTRSLTDIVGIEEQIVAVANGTASPRDKAQTIRILTDTLIAAVHADEAERHGETVIAFEGHGIAPDDVPDGYSYTADVVRKKLHAVRAEQAATIERLTKERESASPPADIGDEKRAAIYRRLRQDLEMVRGLTDDREEGKGFCALRPPESVRESDPRGVDRASSIHGDEMSSVRPSFEYDVRFMSTHQLREIVSARECDEAAKPETGPMRNAESPSGVQELGSSGLALAISDITDLRDSARNVESSEKDHLMWLWRGKAIAYETVLGRLSRLCEGSEAQ